MSQEKIERLAQIQKEIDTLAREGIAIAEETGVRFSLASTPMADNYGSGGLEYIPTTAGEDEWGLEPDPDYLGQWMSSNSYGC